MNLKKLFVLSAASSMILLGSVFAGDEVSNEPEYSEVMYYNFNLDIENDGGNVYFSWNKFEKDSQIKWWKLVFSQKTDDISYPENDAKYLGDGQNLQEAKQWFNLGTYYFRLCAITQDNKRYCGEVEKYVVAKESDTKICTMEYAPVCGGKDNAYTTYSNNCMREAAGATKVDMKYCESSEEKPVACTREYIPVCGYKENKYITYGNKCMLQAANATYKYAGACQTQVESDDISQDAKNKIDERLSDFFDALEAKGYSDEKIVDTIDLLISKLEVLAKQKKYKSLVTYITDVLEEYRAKYEDDLDILDDLLNGF